MTKKRLMIAAVLIACAGLGLGTIAMLRPSPGISKANFDRIEEGMTLAEVEDIFGQKPWLAEPFHEPMGTGAAWQYGNFQVVVTFSNGKVRQKRWFERSGTAIEKNLALAPSK